MASGGLFNTTFTGTGVLAVIAYGTPVVLQVDVPTFVDMQAAVLWSTGLTVVGQEDRQARRGHRTRLGGGLPAGSHRHGIVVVQASEGHPSGEVRPVPQKTGLPPVTPSTVPETYYASAAGEEHERRRDLGGLARAAQRRVLPELLHLLRTGWPAAAASRSDPGATAFTRMPCGPELGRQVDREVVDRRLGRRVVEQRGRWLVGLDRASC